VLRSNSAVVRVCEPKPGGTVLRSNSAVVRVCAPKPGGTVEIK